ncbi:aminoacyl-tRNA hydrolase [Desulfosarcina sp. OttesenSCG-928-A07]|nr:aminoacyl-tRNA hydrolase [Desulfosarcina sp. OttesenSCG-928-A07]
MGLPWKPDTGLKADHEALKNAYLVAGLGNPGPEYAMTRHNIGFRVVDRMVRTHALSGFTCSGINAALSWGTIGGKPVIAAKPMTFMNRSGEAVAAISRIYDIQYENIIIIHDDIDLVYERIKIQVKGGDGGHNGLRSLMDALGTNQFTRVRMGVGRPCDETDVVSYVLSEFAADQLSRLDSFLSQAVDGVAAILCEGVKEAMNRFNRKA